MPNFSENQMFPWEYHILKELGALSPENRSIGWYLPKILAFLDLKVTPILDHSEIFLLLG